MKPSFLSTKRRNTRQHPVARTLRAVTSRRKKQQVAATANSRDFDDEDERDSGSRIARVLTIIFFIHVIAIGMIFIHHYYLKKTLPLATSEATSTPAAAAPRETSPAPRLSTGESSYIVARGDNYARIASAHDLAESELRTANDNAEIRPGLILRIPPKRIIAVEPPAVAAIRNSATDGLVPATDPAHRAPVLVQPNIPRAIPVASSGSSGRTHTIQSGETIWRIAQKYNVDQNALIKLNNISDPARIRIGQTLKIP